MQWHSVGHVDGEERSKGLGPARVRPSNPHDLNAVQVPEGFPVSGVSCQPPGAGAAAAALAAGAMQLLKVCVVIGDIPKAGTMVEVCTTV